MKDKKLFKLFKNKTQHEINQALIQACHNGELEKVKYLLTSEELPYFANIHYLGGVPFTAACDKGHLDVVKYLLTSLDLKEQADIHCVNDYGLTTACLSGHLNIIKYLLTSPELKEHANLHANNDASFKIACENNQLPVLRYLICDINIEKTKEIEDFLVKEKYEIVENMFNLRDLNHQLQKELNSNKAQHNNYNKAKI